MPKGNCLYIHLLDDALSSQIHHQVIEYIDKHLSPFLCGYRKGFHTQIAKKPLLKTKQSNDKDGRKKIYKMEI